MQLDHFNSALAHLTVAEQSAPTDARIHNFRGLALAGLGRNDDAASEFETAIHLNPNFADAYRGLGFIEWTERRLDPATAHLERAIALSPADSFAHYYLGRVLLDRAENARAVHEIEESHVPWPSDPNFLIQLAGAYVAVGRVADAQKTLERAGDLVLSAPQTARIASLLVAARQPSSAVKLLEQFIAREQPSPANWALFDLAFAELAAGDPAAAKSSASRYLNVLPSDANASLAADAHSVAGIAAARQNDGSTALQALELAAHLAPVREEHWLNLTLELMSVGRPADAVSAAQQGLASIPNSYALHLRLGAANLAAGRYEQAETAFRELIDAGDPLPTSYVGLAQVMLRTGRASEAAAELAAAQNKLGASFLLSYFRGLALDRAGQPAGAAIAYRQAVELDPGNADARLGLGRSELASNNLEDAIVQLQEALRLESSNVEAARLLSTAYRRKGDARDAARYAASAGGSEARPDRSLLGDFILPDWQIPAESAGAH